MSNSKEIKDLLDRKHRLKHKLRELGVPYEELDSHPEVKALNNELYRLTGYRG
jgi:hypothetical protein